jgi:hypothetical protein
MMKVNIICHNLNETRSKIFFNSTYQYVICIRLWHVVITEPLLWNTKCSDILLQKARHSAQSVTILLVSGSTNCVPSIWLSSLHLNCIFKYAHIQSLSSIAIKLSQAASHVRWLKADKTNVSRTILCPRWLSVDGDRDGSRNIGFISF